MNHDLLRQPCQKHGRNVPQKFLTLALSTSQGMCQTLVKGIQVLGNFCRYMDGLACSED